jgi:hypothetical protein
MKTSHASLPAVLMNGDGKEKKDDPVCVMKSRRKN